MRRKTLHPIKPGCFRPRANGNSNIHIQYCYSPKQKTLLDTGIVIPVIYWDKKELCITPDLPTLYGNPVSLNKSIEFQMQLVENIISYAVKKGISEKGKFVKEYYKPDLDIFSLHDFISERAEFKCQKINKIDGKKLNVFSQIDDFVASKEKKLCKDFPRLFKNLKDHLSAYQAARNTQLSFQSFTLNFYEDFVDFLSCEYVQARRQTKIVGLKINTVGKTIHQLRRFLNNRMRKKIIEPIDLSEWEVVGEQTDAIYLNWEEIAKVYGVDLSDHPHLIPYRDDLILGCLTALRFSDFAILEKPDVRGDFLYKKQEKSNHWVVIPLREAAKKILKRRFDKSDTRLTNAEFNRHIKTVCKLAGIDIPIKHIYRKANKKIVEVKPKYEWVTSHTCRRSFCTNEFLAGTPVELIMKISGHKSVKDFYRYIRVSPEEAAQKVKELWQQRDMSSVNAFFSC